VRKTASIQRLEGVPACGTHRGEQVGHCKSTHDVANQAVVMSQDTRAR
jgi:hypothetical protein